MLASKSQTWAQIRDKLEVRGEIGPNLAVKCQTHGTDCIIRNDDDFLKEVPSGGCKLRCNTELECGHTCKDFCHVTDREHRFLFKCRFPCEKKCKNNHACKGLCSDDPCPPCSALMSKQLRCSHEKLMRCYQDIADFDCSKEVKKQLPCGHTETVACSVPVWEFRCRIPINKELLCGHFRELMCSEEAILASCKEMVVKKFAKCGHEKKVQCKFGRDEVKCSALVITVFDCGHSVKKTSFDL